ncbi:MAG: hypothetical protein JWM14_2479 [Chitinophagaceae bacterium]|nr:hypothetical protein [Chitinophagaceae bacterium]
MNKIIILIVFIIVLGCSGKQPRTESNYYIIKHPIQKDSSGNKVPTGIFYGDHNFILIDSTRIFYHTKNIFRFCGTGIDYTKPPKLSLKPEDLQEITIEELPLFLEKDVTKSMGQNIDAFVSVSSPNDTIKNRAIQIIFKYFTSGKNTRYIVRNCTEEELYVTSAKIANTKYDPTTINWKKGFDH